MLCGDSGLHVSLVSGLWPVTMAGPSVQTSFLLASSPEQRFPHVCASHQSLLKSAGTHAQTVSLSRSGAQDPAFLTVLQCCGSGQSSDARNCTAHALSFPSLSRTDFSHT